jgi:hypothetical protein
MSTPNPSKPAPEIELLVSGITLEPHEVKEIENFLNELVAKKAQKDAAGPVDIAISEVACVL